MLQIRVFQLTGNYQVMFEASESCRRYFENQVGGLTELWREVGARPCKNSGVFVCMEIS